MFDKKNILIAFVFALLFGVSVKAQSDIRKIDFNNFTYEMNDFEGENKIKITVKNGEYFRDQEDDKLYFKVMSVNYGDLDGDKKDEAVVITVFNSGGTGNFTNGLVFTIRNNKPVVLTEFEGGDRADGGLVSAKIVNNLLVVERNSPGENGGACCPEFIETTRYKWNEAELAPSGETESRELYPAARISFNKKTSSSIFTLKIANGEIKRFVVEARKGQTLQVLSNAKPASDISYRLVRGDGVEKEISGGLAVKLNENGDYIFEISNFSEKDLTVSVTVKIN